MFLSVRGALPKAIELDTSSCYSSIRLLTKGVGMFGMTVGRSKCAWLAMPFG